MGGIPRQAFVGAGANLGNRAATLRAAIERLRQTPGVLFVIDSGVIETEPVGFTDQPRFLNLVAGIETTLSPEALLGELQAIELEFGRTRTVRWGPRTLDLDLLVFAGETRDSPDLVLPHPRMFERQFVIEPLAELLTRPQFQKSEWSGLAERVRALRPRSA